MSELYLLIEASNYKIIQMTLLKYSFKLLMSLNLKKRIVYVKAKIFAKFFC